MKKSTQHTTSQRDTRHPCTLRIRNLACPACWRAHHMERHCFELRVQGQKTTKPSAIARVVLGTHKVLRSSVMSERASNGTCEKSPYPFWAARDTLERSATFKIWCAGKQFTWDGMSKVLLQPKDKSCRLLCPESHETRTLQHDGCLKRVRDSV